ncbi:MAG TPA: PTS lactose/cellobiose transporter subunit IIA [Anaerolineae bacterium]|nr:PTS lactose/cellobiose transporter subunit IIA [Anaerolineae bacterium]
MKESKKNTGEFISEKNEVYIKIIALAGDAKSKVFEALSMTQEGHYSKARQILKEATKNINKARKIQQILLTEEARGINVLPSILLTHAMDILITAESERYLAINIINLFESVIQRPPKRGDLK